MKFYRIMLAMLTVVGVGAVVGCGDPNAHPQSIGTPAEVNNLVAMRAIFDSVKGDWSKLSAEDQTKFNQMAGDAEKGKAMWTRMATPAGATPTPR